MKTSSCLLTPPCRAAALAKAGLLLLALFAAASPAVFAATSPAEIAALRAKAEQGNAIAQYNLGLVYADATETAHDAVEAAVWLSLAAANGATGRALDTVKAGLTPAQLATVSQRLAARAPAAPPASSPRAPAADPGIAQLTTELSAAWKESAQLKAALAEAQLRLSLREGDLVTLNRQLADLNARPAAPALPFPASSASAPTGNAELDQLRSERDALNRQLADADTRARNTTAQLAAKTAELASFAASAKTQLDSSRQGAATADAASQALAVERDALKAQLATATQRATTAEAALGPASPATTKQVIAERDTLKARLATAEAALADANKKTTATETASAGLRRELSQSAEKLAAAEAGLAAARRASALDTKALATERDTLKTQLTAATQRATVAESALADTNKKLAAAGTGNAATKSLTAERDTLKESLAAQQKQIATLNAQLASSRQSMAAVSPTASGSPTQNPKPETPNPDALAVVNQQLADTNEKLTAALRTYTLQQAELDRAKQALAATTAEHTDRATTAAELAAAQAELAALRPQAATAAAAAQAAAMADTDRAAALQRASAATGELAALREQLRITQAAAEAAATENQDLKTRLALAGSPLAANSANAPTLTFIPLRPAPPPPSEANLAVASAKADTASEPPVVSPVEPRLHVVASGDTLTGLAKKYYGSATRWTDILEANRALIKNPNVLPLGTKLRIP